MPGNVLAMIVISTRSSWVEDQITPIRYWDNDVQLDRGEILMVVMLGKR